MAKSGLDFDTSVVLLNLTWNFGNQKMKGVPAKKAGFRSRVEANKLRESMIHAIFRKSSFHERVVTDTRRSGDSIARLSGHAFNFRMSHRWQKDRKDRPPFGFSAGIDKSIHTLDDFSA